RVTTHWHPSRSMGVRKSLSGPSRLRRNPTMDVRIFASQELPAVLAALRHIAVDNQRFTDGERALLRGIAHIHEVDIDPEMLAPLSFDEVARRVVDPQHRKRAVQLAIVTSLVEGVPSAATES